jgi:general secretion pathway protein D
MRFNHLIGAISFAPLMLAPCALAQVPQPGVTPATRSDPSSNSYVMNFRDTPIRDVAEQVSTITGRTLILDPAVTGSVTIIAADPLSAAGVWELFQASLRVIGVTAVRSGNVWRIVPQANAAQSAGMARDGSAQDFVTRFIPLRNLSAEAAQRVLRPLVNPSGSLEALPNPNSIIVTDYADNVGRIVELARQIDSGEGAEVAMIKLQHAQVSDIGPILERVSGGDAAGGVASRIAIDERSNTLLVRGSPAAIAEMRRLANALDIPGGVQPVTRVIRLSNSDAEFVADILRGLSGGVTGSRNPVANTLASRMPSGQASMTGSPGSTFASSIGVAPATSAAPGATVAGPAATSANSDLSIQPAMEINAVVVRGLPAAVAEIETIIKELDVRRPQVMVEAAIVEIQGDAADAIGVQLGIGDGPPEGAFAASSFSTVGPSLRNILTALGEPISVGLAPEGLTVGASTGDGFNILVQALSQSSKANLLSTPSLTTLDNQAAEIVVGQNVPFRTGSFATSGNSRDPFTTIERQDVGITLQIIPRLYDGDVIKLEVSQEVSSLVNSNVVGAADLITNRRSIKTTVLADNGETIVLGGLITDDRISTDGKIPILGDLPLVGGLFGSERQNQTRRTLFVFLRPTILRTPEDARTAAQRNYDKLRKHEAEAMGNGIFLAPPPARLEPEIDGVY